jgi:hypothetical protein
MQLESSPHRRQSAVCSALILVLVAMGTTAGLSQPKTFDGAYNGSLECERITAGVGNFRVPLSIIVRDGIVVAAFEVEEHSSPMQATGTVDPDGAFRFGFIAYTRDYSFRGDYSGTLSATGGRLTGTQVLAHGAIRACKGTVFQVELPKQ